MAWSQRTAKAKASNLPGKLENGVKAEKLGGLGFRDIKIINRSLLHKCMWLWINERHAWWREVRDSYKNLSSHGTANANPSFGMTYTPSTTF